MLEWKRGIPTYEECNDCWILFGGSGPIPERYHACRLVDAHEFKWRYNDWYLPFRVKAIEISQPKTKAVTQRQYFSKTREELWTDWKHVDECWTATGLTRIREVPCE